MPYSPPAGDKRHAADHKICGKDRFIEQQHKSQSAVLYAGLDGEGAFRGWVDFEQGSHGIAGGEGQDVVQEYQDEDDTDEADEEVVVHGEHYHHQGDKDDHADIFPNIEAIQTQFHHLIRTVPANGLIVSQYYYLIHSTSLHSPSLVQTAAQYLYTNSIFLNFKVVTVLLDFD